MNGAASHALDFDDVHRGMLGHPTVPLAPAVFALAEARALPARDLVTAFVAGFEVECRVGGLVGPEHYSRGFHATVTVGSIGAAAAASRLLGLDAERTAHALGIAATQAAGLKSMFGTMCKPLHAGKAAVNGLTAARWAAAGFISNPEVLEVEQGFAATHSASPNPEAALEGLGESFAIRQVLFKYHAACFGTHPGIEAMTRLRAEGLRPSEAEAIELRVPPGALRMCNIQEPRTALEEKFSLRFTAALALAGTGTGEADFTDAAVRDPRLVAIRDRVAVVADPGIGAGETEVVVRTASGATLSRRADVDRPETNLARQWESIAGKFRGLASPVIGEAAAAEAIDLASRIDDLATVDAIVRCCVVREAVGARA